MDHQSAEQAAFTVMSEAGQGQDISRRYNSLNSEEQKQVFSEMKDLKLNPETSKLFGNIELFDNNHDGRMDDALSTGKDGSTRDVYDSRNQRAGEFGNRKNDYVRVESERPADENVLPARTTERMRTAQTSPQRSVDETSPRRPADEEVRNPVAERMERATDNAVRRAGEIVLSETVRGMHRHGGRGPSVGDRIGNRMERESVNGANRVLRDVLRRR